MSEDQKQSPAVPEYLKKFMAPVGAAPQPTEADAMVSSVSVPRISLKAKKFRYIEEGEEIKAEAETHFVILGVEPGSGKMSKTYYDGPYNPGDTSPPTCSSSDGIRPDSWVSSPQNDLCATCPKNVFGSATSRTGKKAKACRDSKRLWVVQPDHVDGTVFGLGVPVTSLKSLSELGQKIRDTGLPMSAAVVKASMVEDESFPILVFEIAGWLHEEHGLIAMSRNEKKDWDGALKTLNPPVPPNLIARSNGSGQPTPQPAAKINQDGSIEGSATAMKNPNVDDALKTWG